MRKNSELRTLNISEEKQNKDKNIYLQMEDQDKININDTTADQTKLEDENKNSSNNQQDKLSPDEREYLRKLDIREGITHPNAERFHLSESSEDEGDDVQSLLQSSTLSQDVTNTTPNQSIDTNSNQTFYYHSDDSSEENLYVSEKNEFDKRENDFDNDLENNNNNFNNDINNNFNNDINNNFNNDINNTLNNLNPNNNNLTNNVQNQQEVMDSPAKLLAAKLRANASAITGKKSGLRFTADFSISNPQSISNHQLKVEASQMEKRKILREQLMDLHNMDVLSEIKEEEGQEIQDEDFEEEDEEDEEEETQEKAIDGSISQTLVKELESNEEAKKLSAEEIEKMLYQKAVELRLSEDLEQIKKIIKIITGQWRSGRLLSAENLEKVFEGNNEMRKELEEQRTMRNQRRSKKRAEQMKTISAQTISKMIEKAMWIQAGEDENASASDRIRAKMAMTSEKSPQHAILARLEEQTFQRDEYRQKEQKRMERSIHQSGKKFKNLGRGKKDDTISTTPRHKLKIKELSRQQSFSFEVGPKESSKKKPIEEKIKKPEIDEDEMDEGSADLQAFLANQND